MPQWVARSGVEPTPKSNRRDCLPGIFDFIGRTRHREETDQLAGRELARARSFQSACKQAAYRIASD